MTPDPYDHVREAFHTVADGLMGWNDPPKGTRRICSEREAEAREDVRTAGSPRSRAFYLGWLRGFRERAR